MHHEGAEAIDPGLEALDLWYAAGLRSLGPVWSRPNAFAHGVPFAFPASPDTGPGLTTAGAPARAPLRRARRRGRPQPPQRGRLLGRRAARRRAADRRRTPACTRCAPRRATSPTPSSTRSPPRAASSGSCSPSPFVRADGADDADTPLATIVAHIRYAVDRIGVEHVALGSDFDGATVPDALGDVAGLPRLARRAARRRLHRGRAPRDRLGQLAPRARARLAALTVRTLRRRAHRPDRHRRAVRRPAAGHGADPLRRAARARRRGRGGASTRSSPTRCSALMVVLNLLFWGPIPAGALWIASQVQYRTDSVSWGILLGFCALLAALFCGLAVLKRAGPRVDPRPPRGRHRPARRRPRPRVRDDRDHRRDRLHRLAAARRRASARRSRRGEAPAALLPPVRGPERAGGQRAAARARPPGAGRRRSRRVERLDLSAHDLARVSAAGRRQRDHLRRAARPAPLPRPARRRAALRARPRPRRRGGAPRGRRRDHPAHGRGGAGAARARRRARDPVAVVSALSPHRAALARARGPGPRLRRRGRAACRQRPHAARRAVQPERPDRGARRRRRPRRPARRRCRSASWSCVDEALRDFVTAEPRDAVLDAPRRPPAAARLPHVLEGVGPGRAALRLRRRRPGRRAAARAARAGARPRRARPGGGARGAAHRGGARRGPRRGGRARARAARPGPRGRGPRRAASQANVLWVAAPGLDGAELARRLERAGVVVAPGGPLGDAARVRVTVPPGREDADRALRAFASAVGADAR